ncbi:MAG: carboxypeptidase-like regulatory domain-containing protein [Planctomycetota bacterium]
MKTNVLWLVLILALCGVAWILQPAEEGPSLEVTTEPVADEVQVGSTSMERTDMEAVPRTRWRHGFAMAPSEESKGDPPVFASGTVTDFDGNPLGSAGIRLESKAVSAQSSDSTGDAWSSTAFAANTDADGRFTLLAEEEEDLDYRIVVSRNRFLTKKVLVVPGSTEVFLVLERPTTVFGEIVIEEKFHDIHMVVHLARVGEVDLSRSANKVVNEQGLFQIKNQSSGDRHLHISFLRDRIRLHTMPLLLSPQGGELDLGKIDLRGLARRIRLKVESHDGTPLHGAWASTLDGKMLAKTITAPLEILTTEERLDLLVGGRQHQTQRVLNVADEESIVLDHGLLIPTTVLGFPEPITWKLLGYWEPLEDIPGSDRASSDLFRFAADGTGSGRVPQPGRYRLHLMAMPITHDVYYPPFEFGVAKDRGIFTAKEGEEPSVKTIQLDNEEVTRLLDKMKAHAEKDS